MVVTCAIIINNGRFLIARRPLHKNQGGKWEFPGGKISGDESPENCIVREIFEEIDLEILPEKRLHAVNYEYPGFEITLLPFVCTIKSGSIKLHEHTAHRWSTLDELIQTDLCAADKKILPQLRQLVS